MCKTLKRINNFAYQLFMLYLAVGAFKTISPKGPNMETELNPICLPYRILTFHTKMHVMKYRTVQYYLKNTQREKSGNCFVVLTSISARHY